MRHPKERYGEWAFAFADIDAYEEMREHNNKIDAHERMVGEWLRQKAKEHAPLKTKSSPPPESGSA